MTNDYDIQLRNPAGQLMNFLDHCENSTRTNTIWVVWGAYFGSEPIMTPQWAAGYVAICDLPRKINVAMSALTQAQFAARNLVGVHLPGLTSALMRAGSDPSQPIASFIDSYDRGTRLLMDMLSQTLNYHWPQTSQPTADVLQTLRDEVAYLMAMLEEDSEVSPTLRLILLDLATRMMEAIRIANIGGLDALLEARDSILGKIATREDVESELRSRPKVATALFGVLTVLSTCVTLFNGSVEAIDSVVAFQHSLNHSQVTHQIEQQAADSPKS